MINVTQPYLPPLDEISPYLEKIWKSKWLTNGGAFHQSLEDELTEFLEVPFISLFNNGTNALITALQALELSGEVITTPYTFVATTHSLIWNNLTPVFVDIDPVTWNIDPREIEKAVTEKTTAILAVHVYGNPCNVEEIQRIAQKHNLKVIYDSAHAFGVKYNNESILNWGDLSTLSFHATKVFNTFEGGAITSHTQEMKDKIDSLKNFGIVDLEETKFFGSNGKMNEVQAAMGLVVMKHFDEIIEKRSRIADYYIKELGYVEGLSTIKIKAETEWNYSYFPVIIDEGKYGISRDDLHERFKARGINCRKYFYPLITDFAVYNKYSTGGLIVAKQISDNVLCLPIYPDLETENQMQVIQTLQDKK